MYLFFRVTRFDPGHSEYARGLKGSHFPAATRRWRIDIPTEVCFKVYSPSMGGVT